MICNKIIGNIISSQSPKQKIDVLFDWFELEKKRIKKIAEDGCEIGIAVNEPLTEGDILGEEGDKIYVVKLSSSHLIRIAVSSMIEMGRLGFELGNRHLSLKIEDTQVTVPYDKPTFEYLLKLGFKAEEVTGEFTDYIVCKGHSHDHEDGHSHEHAHGHSHEHSHEHGHNHDHEHEHSHEHKHSHEHDHGCENNHKHEHDHHYKNDFDDSHHHTHHEDHHHE